MERAERPWAAAPWRGQAVRRCQGATPRRARPAAAATPERSPLRVPHGGFAADTAAPRRPGCPAQWAAAAAPAPAFAPALRAAQGWARAQLARLHAPRQSRELQRQLAGAAPRHCGPRIPPRQIRRGLAAAAARYAAGRAHAVRRCRRCRHPRTVPHRAPPRQAQPPAADPPPSPPPQRLPLGRRCRQQRRLLRAASSSSPRSSPPHPSCATRLRRPRTRCSAPPAVRSPKARLRFKRSTLNAGPLAGPPGHHRLIVAGSTPSPWRRCVS